MKKLKLSTGCASPQNGKGRLRKGIQIALAGAMLVSGVANAVLRDHGPIRTTGTQTLPADFFPDWYREAADAGGMAIGQCIYTDDAGNGPLCLTSTADATANRFAGNIGPEAFYATADIVIPITGGNLSWMGHLEMAYLTVDGEPPATRPVNEPNPQEIVFSRERIRIDLPTTVDNSCEGTYTIRTPFAVHTFDMVEGNRALFYTDDKTAIPGNYAAALQGHTGPFLKWDVGVDGLNPVSAANPAITFTPPVGPVRKYIGDPNVPHLFVGSTVPAGAPAGHPEHPFNDYVEITPPAGCNLGAGAGQPLFEDLASISGPIWDLPIQDPVVVSKATYVRDNNTAALDVWAEGPKNQNIALTASTSASQHMPSVTMQEELVGGNRTGRYHTHLEFDKNQAIPTQVTAVNMSSNPVARATSAVVDAVVVTKSVYDPNTRILCISAHSGDLTSPIPLSLNAPAYGAFGPATGTCPAADANDVVLEKDLDDFVAPDNRFPPEGVLVRSNLGGSETSQPVSLTGISDAALLAGAVDDSFDNIQGTGNTTLDLTGPAGGAAPGLVKLTASADTTPGNFRIVVVSQPVNGLGDVVGTVTAAPNGGNVTYTAEEGMEASELTFYYAMQDITNNTVTNVAKVDLSVDKTVPPPVGVQDLQGVFRTAASVIPVLANDTTGLSSTPINPASIQIATNPALGTAVANANGTITYTPVGQGGVANNTLDSFTYTVANTGGARSTPITVRIALKTAPEAVAFQRVRWSGTRWDIRFTSTYAGVAGAITLAPTAQCALTANGAGGSLGNLGGPVAPGAGANSYVNVATAPAAVGNNYTVTCTTSSGGVGTRTGQL